MHYTRKTFILRPKRKLIIRGGGRSAPSYETAAGGPKEELSANEKNL